MSQVNLGGQQPQVNRNANAQQAQGAGPRADIPQELQNARPSTSVWAKIGRVASYTHDAKDVLHLFSVRWDLWWLKKQ